jgi:hypothetical protein
MMTTCGVLISYRDIDLIGLNYISKLVIQRMVPDCVILNNSIPVLDKDTCCDHIAIGCLQDEEGEL